ncbi:MAG: helix-turn-helix transcriptional regulator, partial [Alistipes sp.]|nr:helix-turn-helix transcriptional regulator [Alistipes sp.]
IEELRVKEILKERGMKMYELAKMMNIAPESLTRALQRNPQYTTLKTIADTLGVSVRDLFKGEDSQVSNNEMYGCIFYNGKMHTFNSRAEIDKFLVENK